MGLLYQRETAQRNIYDISKNKETAKAINEEIFNPVQKHQAEKTRRVNKIFKEINNLKLDKKQKYEYTNKDGDTYKIDEATVAQLYIEKEMTLNQITSKYNIDADRIEKVSNKFKQILDDLYNEMNNEVIKYGYAPIGKINHYFPHFTEN